MFIIENAAVHGNEVVINIVYDDGTPQTYTIRSQVPTQNDLNPDRVRSALGMIEAASKEYPGNIADWFKECMLSPKFKAEPYRGPIL